MTNNGTPVNFAFAGLLGITITGISGTMIQTADHQKQAECEVVRRADGEQVAHGWYDIHDEATLEWIVSGASLAEAITNTALQTPGAFINITGCSQMPSLVGTSWEVQAGTKISGSNTTAKRISMPIKKFTNITAAAA